MPWLKVIFGLGFVGGLRAGGTWASALALIPAWFLSQETVLVLAVIFSLLGLFFCHAVVRAFDSPDPGWFVWDEVCGMMIGALAAPKTFAGYASAFLLFRALDVWKPLFLRTLDRKTGPLGIMWDDLAAGALTAAFMFWGFPAIAALAS